MSKKLVWEVESSSEGLVQIVKIGCPSLLSRTCINFVLIGLMLTGADLQHSTWCQNIQVRQRRFGFDT